MKKVLVLAVLVFLSPSFAQAQSFGQSFQDEWRAKVLEVVGSNTVKLPVGEGSTQLQIIRAEILEGPQKGTIIELDDDFIGLKEGQNFFLAYFLTAGGEEIYSVKDADRRFGIFILIALFALVVLSFGRWQGLRSLLSLTASFLAIFYVLLPLLIKGYSPVLVSILVGFLILFVAIFFTHGFNRFSSVAFAGTSIAISFTGLLALFSINFLNLSGFFSEETVYLNFGTGGILDFRGLLLGGIIIGVLGVLDDIAITQAAVVAEIKSANEKISSAELYKKSIRVGREHVGALVNTIVLAYAGVALPLLLWFSQSNLSMSEILNNEIFATEIARTIVGSIGLILTVPITTFLAVLMVEKYRKNIDQIHKKH